MWWLYVLAVVTLICFSVAFFVMRVRWTTVQEGQQAVIFRLGSYNRIVGPGLISYKPALESIIRTIDVRDLLHGHTLSGLFVNGLPVGVSLNIRYRLDPVEALDNNRDAIARIIQYDDGERLRQFESLLRDALVRRLADHSSRKKVLESASLFEKLLPLLPGLHDSDEILGLVKRDIDAGMRQIGHVLDPARSIVIARLHLSESVGRMVDWRRSAEMLRQHLPTLSDEILLKVVASIDGIDALDIRRLILDGGSSNTIVEQRLGDVDSDPGLRVYRLPEQQWQVRSNPPIEHDPGSVRSSSFPNSMDKGELSADDLHVLKRVPRSSAN